MGRNWMIPAVAGAFLLLAALPLAIREEGAAAAPALPPSAPAMAALQPLERGLWELRERGSRGELIRRVCVGDPSQLLVVRQSAGHCRLFVVSDRPERLTVTFQCGGSGTGRTDLRVETPRLVQLETQGVYQGAPYALSLEGRRIGPCS